MTLRPIGFRRLLLVAILVQATLALVLAVAMGWPPLEVMSLRGGP